MVVIQRKWRNSDVTVTVSPETAGEHDDLPRSLLNVNGEAETEWCDSGRLQRAPYTRRLNSTLKWTSLDGRTDLAYVRRLHNMTSGHGKQSARLLPKVVVILV